MTDYTAAIEAGGTKFNCAIFDACRNVVAKTRIATETPSLTLRHVTAFLLEQRASGFEFNRLGLACFGPLDLNPQSKSYGSITNTPKPNWANTAMVNELSTALSCDVFIDTDVNAAALAEYQWGASKNTDISVYVTVGTGIGGGIIINGKPLHGLIHPEVGHMHIGDVEGIKGVCPFHGSCVEGLASGSALAKIWGTPANSLPDDHEAWQIQTKVLAGLCHNLMMTLSPERIILGGSVMLKRNLLPGILSATQALNGQYLMLPNNLTLADIIKLPGLGDEAGILGAYALTL